MNPYERPVAILLLLVVLAAGDVLAQERMRTLQISNGRVVIDGTPVPSEQLPAQFSANGVSMHLQFSESSRPIFELNGSLYTMDDRRIVPFTGQPAALAFRAATEGQAPPLNQLQSLHQRLASVEGERARASGQELQRLAKEREAVLNQINQVAQQASQIAYVQSIQNENRALYSRMEREARMEMGARELAMRISNLSAGEEREALVSELREKLSEIFEIKQQNRRDEIAQLNERLEELRTRLNERERHKQAIIDRRMADLMGRRSQYDW